MGFGQDGPAKRNPGPTRHSPENCSISVRRELRFGPGKERLMNVVARNGRADGIDKGSGSDRRDPPCIAGSGLPGRSEEHTSELQSLMRISYAVFCLKQNTI